MITDSGGIQAQVLAVGDVNGDGKPDVVVGNLCQSLNTENLCGGDVSTVLNVLLGNGDGTFKAPVVYDVAYNRAIGARPVLGDMNGDGFPDIVITLGPGVLVLLNNGNGTFQSPASYPAGAAFGPGPITVADVNSDGKLDVVTGSFCLAKNSSGVCLGDGAVSVLLGNGDGTLRAPLVYDSGGINASSVAVGDVNGDGKPDVVVENNCKTKNSNGVCQGSGIASVLLGNGNGTLQTAVSFLTSQGMGLNALIGDVNGDGRPDLVTSSLCFCNPEFTVRVLLNNYAAVTTTAVTSSLNPAPVNTQVTFTATVSSTVLIPNGTVVTFYQGATKLGTGTTTNGVASLTTSFSKAGADIIKATVTAGGFLKTSSGTVKQVVTP